MSAVATNRIRFPLGNTWAFAFLTAGAVMAAGFGVDFVLGGGGFPAPGWPDNILLFTAFLGLQGIVWKITRGSRLFFGLSGGRLAVVTLGLICLWAIFLGSLPQVARGEDAPIVHRVMQAPPFLFLLLLLQANLGWGILKHLSEGLRGSSLFLCNHVGVYVVATGTLWGGGDVVRLDILVRESDLAWTGTDGHRAYEMPFAIDLHRFTLEYYPAQLTIIDAESGEILLPRGQDPLTLREGKEAGLLGYGVVVREATESAPWSIPGDDPIPAAYIVVTAPNGATEEGWVSCGSYVMPPVFVGLGEVAFAMPVPRVRLYESRFTLLRPAADPEEIALRVNEPWKGEGWWLYQKGYNVEGGPGARYSRIEAVRDPWLPVVYTGFAFMAVGALLAMGRAGVLLRRHQTGESP